MECNPNVQAIQGYPDLSEFATLITGPLGKSSFGFVNALNTTSTNFPLTIFAPVNTAFERFTSNTPVTDLVFATIGNVTLLDLNFGRVPFLTLAGLNITVRGVVQNGSTLPVPPLIFAQNALVVKADAIVAANGVVHLISNIIDPFIGAAGGFFGPTQEVVNAIETTFGPIIKLAIGVLNIG